MAKPSIAMTLKIVGIVVAFVIVAIIATSHKQAQHTSVTSTSTAAAPATTNTTAPGQDGGEPPGVLPLAVSPGELNPAVTDANAAQTVCTGTSKYRPAESYTEKVKKLMLSTPVGQSAQVTDPTTGTTYAVPGYEGAFPAAGTNLANYELDHIISLSDGGAGADPKNLFPEPGGTNNFIVRGFDGGIANSETKDHLGLFASSRPPAKRA